MYLRGVALLTASAVAVVAWGATAERPAGTTTTGPQRSAAVTQRTAQPRPDAAPLAHGKLLDRYCLDCHNTVDWAGGVAFDALSTDSLSEDAETWEKAIRKMRTGLMPPAGEPRPTRAELEAFAGELEGRLDRAAQRHPHPGPSSLRRLNRTEYANAVRDLIAYDADVRTLLPADDAAEGFDNIADVLGVSPTLLQAYISAAMKISRRAIGDLDEAAATTKYTAPAGQAQLEHIEGLPLGTHGGTRFTHYFPLDAEYEIRVVMARPFRFAGPEGGPPPQVDIVLDGKRLEVPDPSKFRLRVNAGPREIGVGLVDRIHADGVDGVYSKARPPRDTVANVLVTGPFAPTGAGDTPSRRAIFVCRPAQAADEEPCARRILTRLASRAFRRPVESDDPSVETLMGFYRTASASGGFEKGVQQSLARLLADPRFLYRMESEPSQLAKGEIYRISDLDLASRLSFFLWSSIPDEELIAVAAAGKLGKPAELRKQVQRMLADPRSRALVDNFGGQWLRLRELRNAQPLDNGFDDVLRDAFEQETRLLFSDIVREDLSITRLLDANYTYLNERLARHYGISGVRGSYMRRVALADDSPRRGLLGHGSILTVTSVGNRTSPVMRGSWVLETLLAAPPPRPPPGVEADLKEEGDASLAKSVRERLELHRQNPTCASCHQIMDPLGFALENYDLIGRWREKDGALPVNASGTLMDGTELAGPADLRRFLVSQSDQFAISATERLLIYALGRRIEAADQPTVRKIVHEAKADDYRFSSLVMGIVNSVPFQMRVKG